MISSRSLKWTQGILKENSAFAAQVKYYTDMNPKPALLIAATIVALVPIMKKEFSKIAIK